MYFETRKKNRFSIFLQFRRSIHSNTHWEIIVLGFSRQLPLTFRNIFRTCIWDNRTKAMVSIIVLKAWAQWQRDNLLMKAYGHSIKLPVDNLIEQYCRITLDKGGNKCIWNHFHLVDVADWSRKRSWHNNTKNRVTEYALSLKCASRNANGADMYELDTEQKEFKPIVKCTVSVWVPWNGEAEREIIGIK